MKQKKFAKRLMLSKKTISNLDFGEMKTIKGGHNTYLTDCCTVNMATCIIIGGGCFTTDTYQPGGTACP